MKLELNGKRALITGGGGGIGLEVAKLIAAEGCRVAIVDISEEGLQKAERELSSIGAEVHTRICDVTDQGQVNDLVPWIREKMGGLDILNNNAGVGFNKILHSMTADEWKRIMDINFMSLVYVNEAMIPLLLENKRSHMINMSSGQAFFPVPSWGAYATTKFAVGAYSEVLMSELRRHGCFVTTVYPFVVNTPFYSDITDMSWGGKLIMTVIPYIGSKPKAIAKLIVKSLKRGRRRVVHHPIDKIVYYFGRMTRGLLDSVSWLGAWATDDKKYPPVKYSKSL